MLEDVYEEPPLAPDEKPEWAEVKPVLLLATTDWSSITDDGISLKNLDGILREV